ncbi:MAG: metallophosphoesterase [Thermoplasmatales archaeon]
MILIYRIVFAADLHGSTLCFRKLLSIAKNYEKINYLIVNGDLTGKFVTPIVERGDKYFVSFKGTSTEIAKNELEPLLEKMQNRDEYYRVMSQEEYEILQKDHSAVEDEFVKLAQQRLEKWLDLATDTLKGSNTKLLINGGNDDPYVIDDIIKKHENENIIFPENKIVILGDKNEMITSGNANITPWNCPRDISEESLYKLLEEKISRLNDVKASIFNIHVPPYGTVIDKAPKLDKNKEKVVTFAGHALTESVGSKSVRELIEKYQPMLTMHGHVHEGKGACKIGKTICVNPGSEYLNGVLNYVLISVDGNKVRDYIMMSG